MPLSVSGELSLPRRAIMGRMFLATGEWWVANILFGAAFVVAGIGIVGIGWWVVRGDRLNRELEESQSTHSQPEGH